MTRKQIGAVCGAILLAVITPLLVLTLLHGFGGTAQAQPPDPYTKDSMPDFGQHSKSWCWVAAASNSFWWFAQTGDYPELMDPGDEFVEPLSRDATPAAPDNADPHDFDADTVTNEPDGVPDWFDYNDRPEGTGLIYDGTCGDYADNDGDTLYDFTGLIFDPISMGPLPPDPDCTSPWWGGAPPQGDDDSDGAVDEDPINGGVDEDGDSLVDEDDIDIPPFDDDGDTLFDEDPPAYDDDGDVPSVADEDGVVGYRTLLKEVAEAVWQDTNEDGIRDPGERNYVYSEAVEKWDYLIGLQAYIDAHGAALQVHDILHPNYTGRGITSATDENRGAMLGVRPGQLTAAAAANAGVSQVVRRPTLDDYKTELSRSQDVLVWMCRPNPQFDWYCHVVTGQAYDTTDPDPANHFITVADPWTHASVHDDGWLNQGTGPDHNNDYKHPDPEPYDDCDVITPGSNDPPVEDFVIDCGDGGGNWTVIDLIFISPEGPDVKVLDWGTSAPSPIDITVGIPDAALIEETKHNNGPVDTDATATWTAEVTSGNPAGLGVSWVPKTGDVQPDPGTLEFVVTLPQSVTVGLDRTLELTGYDPGSYIVTLVNAEWPLGPGGDPGYDRDPSNNVATTTIFVNVDQPAGIVDKQVMDIVFDDAYDYPTEGPDIGNEVWVNKSENVPFSITSVDVNLGPDEPMDAEISFYMDVPAGCSARWYDPAGHFWADIQTIGGDENVGSSGTPWFPPAKEAGPVTLDLHFQTAEYPGLYEPVGDPQRYTRFFEIHCYGAGDYVFRFCNRADPKFDTDPDPLNNKWCEDLTIHSLHNADIKVLSFYSEPPPPFTFDVSTYNVIDLIEDKHNNGPQDAWSSVYWSIPDIVEDRNGDGIPDINVRWEAEIGDICTYQGVEVPCGEGDLVGMGGSQTGDNCQDGIDNEPDGFCDLVPNACWPGSLPDPDCQDVDDISFYVDLPVSAQTMVSRPLKLHCKNDDPNPYTLTLWNDEWPVNPEFPEEPWEDPDPDNNFQQLDIDVICRADPHYKCYDIFDPTAPPVGELVTLVDQFNPLGVTGVEVTDAAELCPPAIKYVDGEYAGGGTAAPHLKAYYIEGMPDPDVTVNLTTQFGTETDIDVGPAARLLVPALKAIDPDLPTGELPLAPHYVCYYIPPATPPPGIIIDLETQFGLETDVQFDPPSSGWLCAPAEKNGEGDLTAPHLRCYGITGGTAPGYIVNLQTQFSPPLETDVDVLAPWTMCVPAVKEIVADVKIISQTIYDADCISPPPTDIDVSEDVVICVDKVLHNNGPLTPVTVDIAKTASAPPGCSIVPMGPPEQETLDVSVDVSHQEWYTIHCDEASTHGPFTIDNVISIKDAGITDPDPLNNTASSSIGFDVWAYADVKIVGQQILAANCLDPPPTEIDLSEDVDICVHKLLHNNGPYAAQPVNVDVTKTAWASPGATILPPTHTEQVELYFSDVVPHTEIFTIHCTEPSTHTFYVDNDVVVKDQHVIDPDGGASASSQIDVNCLASSDIKIMSHQILDDDCVSPPPATMAVSEDVDVCVRKVLHNNGPYTPVTVHVAKTAYAGDPDASILPPSGSAQLVLDQSVDEVHDEIFTIHCATPGPHSFTVDNDVTVKDQHVSDPNGATASDTIWVECTEGLEADSKVIAVLHDYMGNDRNTTDPDLDLWTTDNVVIQIESDEHNNGPEEALSTITFLADVPLNCGGEWVNETHTNRVYNPVNPLEQEVGDPPTPGLKDPGDGILGTAESVVELAPMPEPVSLIQPVLEGFDLHCQTDGSYTFTFCNKQEVEPPYVDPDPFNSFMCINVDVTSADCSAVLDTDGDTFTDAIECYLPTDQVDDCTDAVGVDDAWPLDNNIDTFVTVGGDVLPYRGRIGAWGGPPADPNWLQRLDINMDNFITVGGDVLPFRGKIGSSC